MQTKFIELNSSGTRNLKHYVNPIMICNIAEQNGSSIVYTMGGQTIPVKESYEEIKELIKKSESFTLVTK
jgi:hypothetical protein